MGKKPKSLSDKILTFWMFIVGLHLFLYYFHFKGTPVNQHDLAWINTSVHPDENCPLGNQIKLPMLRAKFGVSDKIEIGVQWATAGVINILEDGEDALPIGLLSFVKNGYYEFDLTAGEAIYSNLNFKMGVERLYTIYKLGYSSYIRRQPAPGVGDCHVNKT